MKYVPLKFAALLLVAVVPASRSTAATEPVLVLNDQDYLEARGLNVMLAHDYYPEGHQGGVGVIQNGLRVATNGDLRLSPTPGQWQPTPVVVGERKVDRTRNEISVRMTYPDPKKNRTGFNPVDYPDLKLSYVVKVQPAPNGFRIVVDLDEPLPREWVGKVGFNFELFPGYLFDKTFQIGARTGTFPRQADGPGGLTDSGYELAPLGQGAKLVVAPESDRQRMTIEAVRGGELELLDGRAQHTNGWFVVRALVPAGVTAGAIEWLVSPHAIPDWLAEPVIQVSQVGYHPKQPKVAVIELDRNDSRRHPVVLYRATGAGLAKVREAAAKEWGRFLRYQYLQFDFSDVTEPGLYVVGYGSQRTHAFKIDADIFERHVWQPTVEYFLPVQMCHMRVNDRYRVWHGLCHVDDALMAPVSHNHFDGYRQGPSTLTQYQPGEHVPGLDRGGWHDAGDYDLRVESQADTVQGLALAWELFHPMLDNTTIDQETRTVDIHRPDGKPDVLQQIEHGVISIVGGYQAMGRLYRGIQDATLKQYTHLGDAATMTDNQVFADRDGRATKVLAAAAVTGLRSEPVIEGLPRLGAPGSADDRWVFTEENARHELAAIAALAAAHRALKGYNDPLADDCLRIARELWGKVKPPRTDPDAAFIPQAAGYPLMRLEAAIELLQSTGDRSYADAIIELGDEIVAHVDRVGWLGARSLALVQDAAYHAKIRQALQEFRTKIDALEKETPYGLPYRPRIWGAGWEVQRFGVEQYFLHRGAPDIFPRDYMLHAINFILGVHPGSNTASFVSGVGAKSVTTAYGVNRGDWSYIPGGVASGTALIRPDFPELLEWPFLWQQTEYCLGHPTSDYVLLILAANDLLNKK
ncbi:glycoside hydrolase family 9 protein [Opitutus terrae]|uniref:Glycoside hydrolase family 9 n=1 Tax=Opitutus terrae (strain DSM 11246 / JCM 15787 / PB90-1) TaxID=452637 RepID=B1ZW10_OPITP|nr:glycoside hydrolase family 9 protein [Opitutus terrae]ACB76024.1 glycoside hydrolase family 9 [Opitutus terrae PB90-1]